MSRSSIITLSVLALIIIAVAIYTAFVRQSARDTDDGTPTEAAVALTLAGSYTTLAGEPLDFSEYVGDGVLVVNSWASWCPFCVNELPDLALLAEEYKDQGVTVVAINRKENARTANNFIGTLTGVDGIVFALDPGDTYYQEIGGFSMPETIFYDAAGNVAVHKRGFMTLEEMRIHTETALEAMNKQYD